MCTHKNMKNLWLCEKGELCEIQGRNPDYKRGLKPTRSLQKGQWNDFLKHKDTARTVLLSLPVRPSLSLFGITKLCTTSAVYFSVKKLLSFFVHPKSVTLYDYLPSFKWQLFSLKGYIKIQIPKNIFKLQHK